MAVIPYYVAAEGTKCIGRRKTDDKNVIEFISHFLILIHKIFMVMPESKEVFT